MHFCNFVQIYFYPIFQQLFSPSISLIEDCCGHLCARLCFAVVFAAVMLYREGGCERMGDKVKFGPGSCMDQGSVSFFSSPLFVVARCIIYRRWSGQDASDAAEQKKRAAPWLLWGLFPVGRLCASWKRGLEREPFGY